MQRVKNFLNLVLVVSILLFIFIYFKVELSLKYLCLLFLSIGLNLALSINIHELGHLLMGKLCGFKLYAYYLAFLHFDRVDEGFKCSINFNTMFGGLTCMSYKGKASNMKYILYFSAGILMNILSIPLLFLILGFNSLTVINSLLILSLIINNGLPRSINGLYTDGFLIKAFIKNDSIKDMYIKVDLLNNELMSGVRPRDLVFEEASEIKGLYDLNYEIYRYYSYLDQLDFDKARIVMRKLINNKRYLNQLARNSFYQEFIFFYSILEPNQSMAEDYVKLVKFDNDITGLRVNISYNILNEKDNSKLYTLVDKCKLDSYGTTKMEEDLIERLKEIEVVVKHNKLMLSNMNSALEVLNKLDYVVVGDYVESLYEDYYKIHKNLILVDKDKLDGFKNLFKVKEVLGVKLLGEYKNYLYKKEDVEVRFIKTKQVKVLKRKLNFNLINQK